MVLAHRLNNDFEYHGTNVLKDRLVMIYNNRLYIRKPKRYYIKRTKLAS